MNNTEKQIVQELIDTMDGYITLLSNDIEKNCTFLNVHGVRTSDADIKSGAMFREKISLLKLELKIEL